MLADGQGRAGGLQLEVGICLFNRHLFARSDCGREEVRPHNHLLVRQHLSFANQRYACAGHELKVHHHFAVVGLQSLCDGITQCFAFHDAPFLWLDALYVDVGDRHIYACVQGADMSYQLQVVKCAEVILIIDLKSALLDALVTHPCILIEIGYLVGVRVQTAVGRDDAVAVEVVVMGGIAAIIATIGEDFAPRDGAHIAQCLVDEVPDKTTLVFGIASDELPVLLETTHRVAHGVGILALNERAWVVALGIT